jgi:iron complex transport system ATP-binding protein
MIMTDQPILDIRNMSAGYGGCPVLENITLEIKAGDFIAIMGPNGAGKSTLLKVMCGLLKPSRGELALRGGLLSRMGAMEIARRLSVVHQFAGTVMPYTVRDFAALGMFPRRDGAGGRRETDEALDMCDISGLADRSLAELSGGERQLAFIARALVQNRDLILLDEPVSHLDVNHVTRIMDILHRLNREGGTVITVLHDLNLAADYCGRIIALKDHGVFFDGAPSEVMRYDLIETLFGVVCVVRDNPISGRPFAYVVPEHLRKK